uniref:peptide-methionine (S)-S-oxide reductase n=1 Tax=Grammatophora oceanica TaxID=210454 RepID=A0A7S1Y7D0_9STRA
MTTPRVLLLTALIAAANVTCFVQLPAQHRHSRSTSTRTTPKHAFSTQLQATSTASSSSTKATLGSVVTIDCDIKPEGDFVPEPLVDLNGKLTFWLGGGNYLPGLHTLVDGMTVGEKLEGMSLDAGWGEKNPELVLTLNKKEMGANLDVTALQVGVQLMLANGMKASVTEVTDETFTIDANPPLAGASYKVQKLELLSVEQAPTQLEYTPGEASSSTTTTIQACTFALGCFWGGELAFMRQKGVVGTKVGYTQGEKIDPTYQEVCSGTTGHTEAIMVYYDPREVSYEALAELAMDRLGENKFLLNQVGGDRGTQYRHGIYYHNDEQKASAEQIIAKFGADCKTECLPAGKFYDAEDYHQQYLLKGGQSARKDDATTIRCYG